MPSTHLVARRIARRLTRQEAGFTIIEVLVAALIIAIVSAGAATAFAGSLRATRQQRIRSEAQALAQSDQNRLRGMNVDALSNLDQTTTTQFDNWQFTIHQTSSYVSGSSDQSCANPSAAYLRTTTTVVWNESGAVASMANHDESVALSSLLTPTVGSIKNDRGALAVSVTDAANNPAAGVTVAISGGSPPTSLTRVTDTSGCVIFGDIPTGTYTVTAAPSAGVDDVDAQSGREVTAQSPDPTPTSVTVTNSSTAVTATFELDAAASPTFPFTNVFPDNVAVTTQSSVPVGSLGVVLQNSGMASPNYRVCTALDNVCPEVGSERTTFPATAWASSVQATPLFPFSDGYSAYAGLCPADAPQSSDPAPHAAPLSPGQTGAITPPIPLPAMVIQLMAGGNEVTLPAGAKLVVTDNGCGVRYIGYTAASGPPALGAGEAALPLNSAYLTAVDTNHTNTGLLHYPGMPYGKYTVCYQGPAGNVVSKSVTNAGQGEVIPIPTGTARPGAPC